ncbi:transmembrane protein 180-like [Saccoglossus kowalevskii]
MRRRLRDGSRRGVEVIREVSKMKVHYNAFSFALIQFALSMLNSLFTFYYVNLFLNTYKISQRWFTLAEGIYLFWSSLNDPLFAYIQDTSAVAIFHRRRLTILYGAPLLAISFILPWFPWGDYEHNEWLAGLHLVVSLCLYDTLLTFVLLAHSALYAEISFRHEERLRLTKYSQFASLFGSSAVLWAEMISNNFTNIRRFQGFCIMVAITSWLAMHIAVKSLKSEYESPADGERIWDRDLLLDNERTSIWTLYKQIFSQWNLVILLFVNFFAEFHMTFGRNFLSIFADELIPSYLLPNMLRKALYGSVFILPQIFVILTTSFVERVGGYRVYLMLFCVKVFTAILLYMSSAHPLFLVMFFVIDTSLPMAASKLFNLLLADNIDADMEKNKRVNPLSSMFFAANAVIIKPAQSIAPILIVAILNKNGFQDIRSGETTDPDIIGQLHYVMFQIVWLIPFVCGLVQIALWLKYTLRDSHLTSPKTVSTIFVSNI